MSDAINKLKQGQNLSFEESKSAFELLIGIGLLFGGGELFVKGFITKQVYQKETFLSKKFWQSNCKKYIQIFPWFTEWSRNFKF